MITPRGLLTNLAALLLLICTCPTAFSGGGPAGVAVVYDPSDPSAVTVANYYQQVRGIPERNMIPYTFPANTTTQFASRTQSWDFLYALRTEITNRGLNPQIQAIALMGVVPKLANQSVASFNNGNAFAITSFLYLSPNYGQSTFPVSNWTQSNQAYADESTFNNPPPAGTKALNATTSYNGQTYWPAMLLGYTGRNGLRISEWFSVIDRAKQRDGTKPDGTIYWPLNSDVRSTTREVQIPVVAPIWQARGIRYMVTGSAASDNERWVQNRNDIVGGIVGDQNASTPAGIRGGNTYLGGWIDQLTSNGGNIEWFVSQDNQMIATKWLRAGADGASGSAFEPYAYTQKFAHAHIHTHLRAGASQVEAFWQAIKNPSEITPIGDPLLQPWASLPVVTISSPLNHATISGTVALSAAATPTGGKTLAADLDLFVDGRRVNIGGPGETILATRTSGGFILNTTTLTDGWHDLRVVAYNNDSVRTQSEARIGVNVNNAGRSIALSGPTTYNPDSTSTSFTATLTGLSGLTSLRLQANGRTVATFPAAGGTVNVNLTATSSFAPLGGNWVLYAVGTRADGSQVSSPPFTTTPDWPATPATTNPALGPKSARVKYWENTNIPGFIWDDISPSPLTATPPTATTTIDGDTSNGISLSIDAIANDADATTDPITLGGTTYTLTYANKPGFQVDFWFYAPKDDWYEFGHNFSERVYYQTTGQSEKREFYLNGQLLTDREGVLPPRRLAAGWHLVRARFALNAGSRFGANVSNGPSPQGWMSWKARVRGGPNVDFQIIPPALCASTVPGTVAAADVPAISSVTPTTTVTGTTRALSATASLASGTLTYHWTRLSGGTHAGFHTGRWFTPSMEPQTINFSANGSAAASATTVTFYEPGDYVLGLRVAGPNASAYTTVPLTVAATGQSTLYLSFGSPPLAVADSTFSTYFNLGLQTIATSTKAATITSNSAVVSIADTSGLAVGQRVTGTGIPTNTLIQSINPNVSITLDKNATANATSLSYSPVFYTSGNPVVSLTNTSGLVAGLEVTGSGIPAGTVIQSVVPNVSITLSSNPTATAYALSYYPVSITNGSANVIVNNPSLFAVGQRITGTGIPTDTFIQSITGNTLTLDKNATANGIGLNYFTVVSGSAVLKIPNTTGLAVGQRVTGTGIPATTFIQSIVPNSSITLTNNATATSSSSLLSLTYSPVVVTSGSPAVTITNTANLAVGQRVTGTGIPADTYITALVANSSITLSKNATANGNTLTYFPLSHALPGLPFTLVATSVDQFGNRIPITPTNPGQPTVQWTSTDPTATFNLTTADGENARFISASTAANDQNITVTATGVNGRTGTNSTIITLKPNFTPAKSGTYLVGITQNDTTKVIGLGGNVTSTGVSSLFKQSLLAYAWSVVSTPSGQSLTLSGTSGANINAVASGPGTYSVRLVVTNPSGSTVSETRTFTVDANGDAEWVGVLDALSNQTRFVGEVATFQYYKTGPLPNYQWQTSTDGGVNWANIAGSIITSPTTSVYTLNYGPVTAADNSRRFRLQLINSLGTSITNSATLTVSNPSGGVFQIGDGLNTTFQRSVNESVGSVTYTIRRMGQTNGAVSVGWQSVALSGATAGTDYQGLGGTTTYSGTLNWAAGDSSDRVLTFPIVNDSTIESTEGINVYLWSPSGASIGTYSGLQTYILDDDGPGAATFASASATVKENDGQALFTVRRTGPTVTALTVNYTTAPATATPPQDYTTTSGTLTWPVGDTADKQIAIPLTSDFSVEGEETFTVTLSASDAALLGTTKTATVTIQDAPYQQWLKTHWPGSVPAVSLYSDHPTALRALSPLFYLRLGETAGSTATAVEDAGGTSLFTAPFAINGAGNYALGATGPLPSLWSGFETGNTAASFTATATTGATANLGTAGGLSGKLHQKFTFSAFVRTTESSRIMALLGGQTNTTAPAITGGATTNGSFVVTCTSTSGLADGMGISGTGIPGGTVIDTVLTPTSLLLSAAATATNTGLTFTATDRSQIQILLNNSATNTGAATADHLRLLLISRANKTLSYSVRLADLPTGKLTDGQWHHIAITVPLFTAPTPGFGGSPQTPNDNTDFPRFFFDGVEARPLEVRGTETIGPSDTFGDFPTGLRLGAAGQTSGTPTLFFNGSIDEVAFFPRILTDAEIASLTAARPAPAPPAVFADTATPANDGMPNLLKYALGLNPLSFTSATPVSFGMNASNAEFSFTRRRDATDIIYRVERSTDLVNWAEVWTSQGDPYPDANVPQITEMLYQNEAGVPRVFYRLRVARP
jgi:hypothetical protein